MLVMTSLEMKEALLGEFLQDCHNYLHCPYTMHEAGFDTLLNLMGVLSWKSTHQM
jgi:hypothetical protein